MSEDTDLFSLMVQETFNPVAISSAMEKIFQGVYLESLHVFRFSFTGGVIMDFPQNIAPFDQLLPKNFETTISYNQVGQGDGIFDALVFLMPGLTQAFILWKKDGLPNQVELRCLFSGN